MSPSPPEVTASINDLVSANRALRSKLLDNERFLTHAVQLMDEGTSPGQVLVTVPSVQDRRAVENAVNRSMRPDTRSEWRSFLPPLLTGYRLAIAPQPSESHWTRLSAMQAVLQPRAIMGCLSACLFCAPGTLLTTRVQTESGSPDLLSAQLLRSAPPLRLSARCRQTAQQGAHGSGHRIPSHPRLLRVGDQHAAPGQGS
jgi:hypothetical protein